jgi:lipoprotein NlpD
MRQRSRQNAVLAVIVAAAVSVGCASRKPAPVVDRGAAAKPPATAQAVKPEAPVPAARTYTVKRGDTLYSIALEQGVDWRELAGWNQISDPSRLSVGQVLRLQPADAAPSPGEVTVKPIVVAPAIEARPIAPDAAPAPDVAKPGVPVAGMVRTEPKGLKLPYSEQNLAAVARATEQPPAAAAAAPAAKPEAPRPETAKPEAPKPEAPKPEAAVAETPKPDIPGDAPEDRVNWTWPAAGRVIATFSENGNKGVDIDGKLGEPVLAAGPGKVVYSGTGIRGYGQLVIVKHNDKYLSAYAHNSKILVKEGQDVTRGQKIAEIGRSDADRPKLHFEIRRFGKPIDPLQFLPNRP